MKRLIRRGPDDTDLRTHGSRSADRIRGFRVTMSRDGFNLFVGRPWSGSSRGHLIAVSLSGDDVRLCDRTHGPPR